MNDYETVHWNLVWQGVLTEEEAEATIAADPVERVWLDDNGGWWATAIEHDCNHMPRFHPREDFSMYCTLCGQEDIDPLPVAADQHIEIDERIRMWLTPDEAGFGS